MQSIVEARVHETRSARSWPGRLPSDAQSSGLSASFLPYLIGSFGPPASCTFNTRHQGWKDTYENFLNLPFSAQCVVWIVWWIMKSQETKTSLSLLQDILKIGALSMWHTFCQIVSSSLQQHCRVVLQKQQSKGMIATDPKWDKGMLVKSSSKLLAICDKDIHLHEIFTSIPVADASWRRSAYPTSENSSDIAFRSWSASTSPANPRLNVTIVQLRKVECGALLCVITVLYVMPRHNLRLQYDYTRFTVNSLHIKGCEIAKTNLHWQHVQSLGRIWYFHWRHLSEESPWLPAQMKVISQSSHIPDLPLHHDLKRTGPKPKMSERESSVFVTSMWPWPWIGSILTPMQSI